MINLSNHQYESLDYQSLEFCTHLNVSSNRLTHTIGMEHMTSLIEVDLSHNKIQIVQGWSFLTQLQFVDLSDNLLETVFGLRNCVQVHTLLLCGNLLQNLEGLEGMANLVYLDINDNDISEVQTLRQLSLNTQLQVLFILRNPIKNYRQYCYSIIPSLAILNGKPTAPVPGHQRPECVKNSYAYRKSLKTRVQSPRIFEKLAKAGIGHVRNQYNRVKVPNINLPILSSKHLPYHPRTSCNTPSEMGSFRQESKDDMLPTFENPSEADLIWGRAGEIGEFLQAYRIKP